MSGLEPLAAFGLACNLLQTVDVAVKTAALCKQVFDTGATDLSANLSLHVENTVKSVQRLEDSIKNVGNAQSMKQDEKELLGYAVGCRDLALNMKKETDKMAISSAKGKRWASFVAGLRIKFGNSVKRIEEMEKEMQRYQSLLESGLLVRVWYVIRYYPNGYVESGFVDEL